MEISEKIKWSADYDVIVLGFGGAGGTAARFAADKGAKVLLVDSAPYGHEGGNTRYSAQHIAMAHSKELISKYYSSLTSPYKYPKKTMNVYLDGLISMPTYIKKYFDIDPFIWSIDYKESDHLAHKTQLCEYPEYDGSSTFDFALIHNRDFDGSLWKEIRKQVLQRKESINIWLKSRATNLITDKGIVIGVRIERNHNEYYVHAKEGVVLATGGFENNIEMQQNYFHVTHLTPLGSLYNKGDGLNMAAEVGAKIWHMDNYESLGIVPSYVIAENNAQRGHQISNWKNTKSGSIFVIAPDGTRFMREDAKYRHGHIYEHGDYLLPHAYDFAWLIFDEKQYNKFLVEKESGKIKYPKFFEKIIYGNTYQELAKKINVSKDNLKNTILKFNRFAKNKADLEFNRDPESLTELSGDKIFAIKLAPAILNTQGGPEHNEKAQVLSVNEEPIPHLYSAGELGGMCVNRYQGGSNLADCLIFGKIAGNQIMNEIAVDSVKIDAPISEVNDILEHDKTNTLKRKPNQYIASTDIGIGDKITVRVTYKNKQIKKVEVLESNETPGIGEIAVKEIPRRIVEQNTTKVDAVSGASTTSRAIEEAVDKAIDKAKREDKDDR